METNKLLTLEDIEKMDAGLEEFITDHPSVNEINVRLSAIKKALATARAYWELKNDPKTAQETSYHYIGMLRQWLNECRITDPSKMVDNKDIMEWLGIPVPAGYRTDREVISEALGVKDDKPHPATLKVIVEAMKGMLNQYHFANSSIDCGDLATFTESLEKHLE